MEEYYLTVTHCSFISVTDAELKRLKEAFKRVSTLNGCITKQSFIKDVLGEGVPTPVAEVSFNFVLLYVYNFFGNLKLCYVRDK